MRFDIAIITREYAKIRPTYQGFAKSLAIVLEGIFPKDIIHKIEHRAKDIDSFERKSSKLDEDGAYKYPKPLEQLTDLAGVRVIVFTRNAVSQVVGLLHASGYDVREIEDVGDRVYKLGRFGYQSVHLLVYLGKRSELSENEPFCGMVCEVQVRTILQHAWAELEHDIQYKAGTELPLDLRKRFTALAGAVDIADREFERVLEDSLSLREAVVNSAIDDLTITSLQEQHKSQGGNLRLQKRPRVCAFYSKRADILKQLKYIHQKLRNNHRQQLCIWAAPKLIF